MDRRLVVWKWSTTNPVSARRVDSSVLVFSLSSHRYSYISLLFNSRFNKAYYQAFFWVLIDLIVELLGLIIKPFDNQTES
jgi:hypothetical protein